MAQAGYWWNLSPYFEYSSIIESIRHFAVLSIYTCRLPIWLITKKFGWTATLKSDWFYELFLVGSNVEILLKYTIFCTPFHGFDHTLESDRIQLPGWIQCCNLVESTFEIWVLTQAYPPYNFRQNIKNNVSSVSLEPETQWSPESMDLQLTTWPPITPKQQG